MILSERGVVKIEFDTLEIRDLCENEKSMKKKFGNACSNKLKARIADLLAAMNVSELVAGRPHPLKYKRSGHFSVSISGALRLIFECGNNPIPRTSDETVNWNQVTIVKILSIEDYHE